MDAYRGGGTPSAEELAALANVPEGGGPDGLLPALHALNDRVGWISRPGLDEVTRRLGLAPAVAFGVASFYAMLSTTPRPPTVAYMCDDVPCRLGGAVDRISGLEAELGPPRTPRGDAVWERSPCLGLCDLAPAALVDGRAVRVSDGRSVTAALAEAVARHPVRPHYVVVNADESESGTFKDRVLLEWDPYAVLEATAIAAYTCGAERAFVYVRGEYRHAAERLAHAIAEAEHRGLLGDHVLGSDVRVSVELRRGAGAYICGEETALLNSIEGKRGEPRSKPPFPVQVGLFGRPTVINNVETLACVPVILTEGVDRFRALGTAESPGTKLFSLSGHVARPGVYEVASGTPLRALVEELGGGVPGGRALRAIQCGGAAATFLTPRDLDLPLSFEGLRARGATVGSGAVVVLDETADLRDVILRGAQFFAHESCGQCVPCRIGTQRQVELLEREARGEDVTGLLAEVALAMKDASICGLGQTAASMVQSAFTELGLR